MEAAQRTSYFKILEVLVFIQVLGCPLSEWRKSATRKRRVATSDGGVGVLISVAQFVLATVHGSKKVGTYPNVF